jgi:hypothetical protein
MNRASNEKIKKKVYKYSLLVIAIILFIFITKNYLLDGIIQILKDESNSTEKDKGSVSQKDIEKYKNKTKIEDKDDDDDDMDNNDFNREKFLKYYLNGTKGRDEDLGDGESFILIQNGTKKDINSFSSPQLRNPKNIKLIEKLDISLELEYEKFVHLKIKDADNKRWEIPENDILNKDYLADKIDNSVSLNKYTKWLIHSIFIWKL